MPLKGHRRWCGARSGATWMDSADARAIAIATVLRGLRLALGLPPDTRADLIAAFAADDGALARLRERLGELLENARPTVTKAGAPIPRQE
jgi:hypothetical protein